MGKKKKKKKKTCVSAQIRSSTLRFCSLQSLNGDFNLLYLDDTNFPVFQEL